MTEPHLPDLLPNGPESEEARLFHRLTVGMLVATVAVIAGGLVVNYVEDAPRRAAESSLAEVELPIRWSMKVEDSQGDVGRSGFGAWRTYGIELGPDADASVVQGITDDVRAAVADAGWTDVATRLHVPTEEELASGRLASGIYEVNGRTDGFDGNVTVLFAFEDGHVRASSSVAVAERLDYF